MVSGLEAVKDIDKVLVSANQVREEFRKNFPFPVILWVDDHALDRFARIAPDFKSWAGSPVSFELSDEELATALQVNVEAIFHQALKAKSEKHL